MTLVDARGFDAEDNEANMRDPDTSGAFGGNTEEYPGEHRDRARAFRAAIAVLNAVGRKSKRGARWATLK